MTTYRYTTQLQGARAVGIGLPISVKHSVEVCAFIRGKELQLAKRLLQEVIAQRRAVPYRRYTFDLGHKAGMSSGRYPVSTCKEILRLLESAEANAQFKGMNTAHLTVVHVLAHKASEPHHAGRHRGRRMKRAHVEMLLAERAPQQRGSKGSVKKKAATVERRLS